MGRKSDTYLFELIKSLTKGERKNFNLFTKHHFGGDKKYWQLFELIDTQKQYDEEKIKNHLKINGVLTPLAGLKNYLLELILKSLRYYYIEDNTDEVIQTCLLDAKILHKKGFHKERDNSLKKAKQLAIDFQKYELHLLILEEEYRIKITHSKPSILNELNTILEKIKLKANYRELVITSNNLRAQGLIRDKKTMDEWDVLVNHPLLRETNLSLGRFELINHYTIKRRICFINDDFVNAIYYQNLIIELYELNKSFFIENKVKYFNELVNQIWLWSLTKETEKALLIFKKLFSFKHEKLFPIEKKELYNALTLAHGNLLGCYIHLRQFNEGILLINEVEEFLLEKETSEYDYLIYLNNTILYLSTDNYKVALFWNNKLLNNTDTTFLRKDFLTYATLFNLIIHYELHNYEVLPYLIRSAYRYFSKNKQPQKVENIFMGFFKKRLSKMTLQEELVISFREVRSQLEEITNDHFESTILEEFDFIAWLSAKIENRPFAEVLKEK